MESQETRNEIQNAQSDHLKRIAKAQEIVLEHLESAIENEDSATVAAMAEILKL